MKKICGKAILKALEKDAEYVSQPEAMQEAMRPFVEKMPEVLAQHLDSLVSFETVIKAKVTFLKDALGNGYISKIVASMPEESFGWMDVSTVELMMEEVVSLLVQTLSEMLVDVPAFLRSQGVSDRDMVARLELTPPLWKLYGEGALTIADLLVSQPMIIIKNTD